MTSIDGSFGEGGGQILRTSLSLAAITGKPMHIKNIRANRKKPGLMRQHLACAKAVAEICRGELEGAELNSQALTLKPGRIHGGDYRFVIGSAGNTLLLAQAVLPVLLFADSPSRVVLQGGTYTMQAPVFDFFERVYLPCLHKMGLEVEGTMERAGFYPAGGGRVVLFVKPARVWRQLSLIERGELQEARVTAIGSGLDQSILTDELKIFQAGLAGALPWQAFARNVESDGPGNVLFAELAYENLTELFSVCGRYGLSRKSVAKSAISHVKQYLGQGWVVGQFLADQLMLPLALGAGGNYLTGPPTLHAESNRQVIRKFLDVKVEFKNITDNLCEMEVQK
ncbi:MAG: RNA 3'-terminal phosphate cyclase [Lentisphaerae bacterium]|jgi:RNA 3'-terminal phosphate cyclase (ATP)|nr:RNA 3'-terminal phosphate cyclase [Lentisphaerota bacterium]